jgi:hypothetical protein
LPSVTEILKVLAKPGLDKWKETQLLQAALTLPAIEGESLDEYAKRVMEDSKKHAQNARELGTKIHGAIERSFAGKQHEYADNVSSAVSVLPKNQDWNAERSFAHSSGYGGKCDLHSSEWAIDFKTTEKNLDELKTWDEHHMQLSAYRNGLAIPHAKCGIVYVSVVEAKSRLIEITEEELLRGFDMFMAALSFWKAAKKYYPSENY